MQHVNLLAGEMEYAQSKYIKNCMYATNKANWSRMAQKAKGGAP
jgi:hypothetical protein